MSSSPTAPTSTTASSTSWHFGGARGVVPPDQQSPRYEIVACGALAGHVREIAARRRWPVSVRSLPAVLHNRPEKIPSIAERAVVSALATGHRVALAYADCGSYGALDSLCSKYGLTRLSGLHCYDVLAGPSRIEAMFAEEPGTYVLTDFLLRGFDRLVINSLGLDRYPQLWTDYFGHYRRLVWLTQGEADALLAAEAARVAGLFGLPLVRVETGTNRLERELERLVGPC